MSAGRWAIVLALCSAAACSFEAAPSLGRYGTSAADSGTTSVTDPEPDTIPDPVATGSSPSNPVSSPPTAAPEPAQPIMEPPVQPPAAAPEPPPIGPTHAMNASDAGTQPAAPLHDAAASEPPLGDGDGGASPPVDAAAGSTDQAAPHSCPAGNYLAEFACISSTPVPDTFVTTRVAFRLLPTTQRGSILALQDANLSLTANGFFASGEMTGTLDCDSGRFHADINNALVAFTILLVPTLLNGAADGTLDDSGTNLTGDWMLGAFTGDNCAGQWTAALQP